MLVKKSKKKTRYSGETTRRQLGTNDCFFFFSDKFSFHCFLGETGQNRCCYSFAAPVSDGATDEQPRYGKNFGIAPVSPWRRRALGAERWGGTRCQYSYSAITQGDATAHGGSRCCLSYLAGKLTFGEYLKMSGQRCALPIPRRFYIVCFFFVSAVYVLFPF